MAKILIVAILAVAIFGKLIIYSPHSLKAATGKGDGIIETSVANFGLIPYGHSIVGSPYFDPDNKDGCSKFTNKIGDNEESPIVLVERGNCSFVKKVREVEHAGGKMAIVIDEVDNESMDSIIMVDDGTGNGIKIPSVMINKKEGDILLNYYNDASVQ